MTTPNRYQRQKRYIIEHPRRGVLKDLEYTDSGNQRGRFGWSIPRTKGAIYYTLEEAIRAKSRIEPQRLQDACQIRQEPTDQEVTSAPYNSDLWKIVG